MDYSLIKLIHVASALISISGFVARGMLAIQQSPRLSKRWIKIAPHINDSVLLISAITLAIQAGISPLEQSWLAAKIILLILYIFLGLVTLRIAKTRQSRVLAYIAAIVVFGYILAIAESKSLVFF